MSTSTEKHAFQAEVNQVLSIVVNSLYSHREVFLRELISNASDAIDQLNLRALTEPDLLGGQEELRIELLVDEGAGTLTIRDNGGGMSRQELIDNLGTIARSGTKRLMQSLSAEQKKDVSLIGQFGVGFYSAFLVADTVRVTSRKAGAEEAWTWESQARDDFELRPGERAERGTDVTLHLKDDAREYLQAGVLHEVVRKYSDYVRWPIRMRVGGDGDGEQGEWQTLTAARALWTRPKNEITREQLVEFYKHTSHDWREPLAWTHFKIEGTHELTGLLFVPEKAPMDLLDRSRRGGLRLFVKRVFILDDAQEILPDWLRFVRGVVDSEDLPLNVSREVLQRDATTRFIKKQVTNKVLTLLEELAAEGSEPASAPTGGEDAQEGARPAARDRYGLLWREFGRLLKEGVCQDGEARTRLAGLLRYESSRGEGLSSLAAYKERMLSDQKALYYVTADSLATAQASPHIEALRARGFEVLYMTDPIDEWVVETLGEFEGTPLVSAAKGALDLPESAEEKATREQQRQELGAVLARMHAALQEKVKEVRVTDRLTDSPACLVSEAQGLSLHMERVLREAGHALPEQLRILEVNPGHPVIRKLRALAEQDDARFQRWTQVLHDQALLAEGVLPADPAGFARRIAELMADE